MEVYALIQHLLPAGFQTYIIGEENLIPIISIDGTVNPQTKCMKKIQSSSTSYSNFTQNGYVSSLIHWLSMFIGTCHPI